MLIKVPQDASPDVIDFCRQVNDYLDRILGGRNLDFSGRRITNAGNAVDLRDYVTYADVVRILTAAGLRVNPDGTAQQFASVKQSAAGSFSSNLAGDLARASLRP